MTPKKKRTSEEMLVFPSPESIDEKLSWVLTVMEHSAEVRREHFRYRDEFNKQFITKKIDIDLKTGKLMKNKDMYGAIHVDYIFSVIRSIESFHGALIAAFELTKESSNLQRVIDIIMNPTSHRGGVMDLLMREQLSEQKICRLMCISQLTTFSSEEQAALRRIFTPMFEHFKAYAFFSQKYWELFQSVRHVYAHNYRFLFYDGVIPGHRPRVDETVIGFINPPDPTEHESVYIGAIQRIAMGELASRLNGMERWVYTNMRLCTKNGCEPILPPSVGFLTEEQKKEYQTIWKAQEYDFPDPERATKMFADVGGQIALHMKFLKQLDRWGFKIPIVDQHGIESEISFQKLHHKLTPKDADTRLKEALERERSKRRRRKKVRKKKSC